MYSLLMKEVSVSGVSECWDDQGESDITLLIQILTIVQEQMAELMRVTT
jgi:hypothetical protein